MCKLFSYFLLFACVSYCHARPAEQDDSSSDGDTEDYIVNGTLAAPGQFPFLVSIRVDDYHNCGGAIIHPRFILTAAHCADGFAPTDITVVAGSNSLSDSGTVYEVEELISNAQWNGRTNVNDIALFRLKKNITFVEKFVSQINLPTDENDGVPVGESLTVGGWGYTSYPNSEASEKLLYVNMTVLGQGDCGQRWAPGAKILPIHLCATNDERRGTCLGDSGGPYVYNGKVYGVHIFGDYCKLNKPSVATQVKQYLPWIQKHMIIPKTAVPFYLYA